MQNYTSSETNRTLGEMGPNSASSGVHFIVFVLNASLNIFFSLTATLGNAVILAALPQVTSLHAPSRALLSGLALSDLAVGLLVHPTAALFLISGITNSSRVLHVVSLFFSPLANYVYAVSLLTITAISVDRFLAVHCQLKYRGLVTLARVKCVLSAVWLFPAGVVAGVVLTSSSATYDIIDAVYFTVCIVTPGVLYALIYKKLRQLQIQLDNHRTQLGPQVARSSAFNIVSYQRSVITMLLVYGTLLFCYLPRFVLIIINFVSGDTSSLWFVSHFSATLVFFNSSLNPVIYCWRVSELRQASVRLVKRKLCCIRKQSYAL